MQTNERTAQRSFRVGAGAWGLALLVAACGGTTTRLPSIGSESHFLAQCETSCEGGLDCIGGICTRACLTDRASCSDLADNASCTNQSVEPGQVAVCDVSCATSADCRANGSGYGCAGGFCREADGTQTGSSAAGAGGSAGSGPTEAPGPACETFQDQSPPPDLRAITIVNAGRVPLYLFPIFVDCTVPTSLVQVERDGKALNTLGGAEPGASCQQVIKEGPPIRYSITDCFAPPAVRLDPQQTLQQPVGLEVVQQQLPSACTTGAITETVPCYSRVIPQPAAYTLTIHAALDDTCDPRGNCLCDLNGQCSTSDPPLAFSFPSAWYFQNQELSIAAPE